MFYDDPSQCVPGGERYIYGQYTALQPVVDPDRKVIQLWTNVQLLGAFSGLSSMIGSERRDL